MSHLMAVAGLRQEEAVDITDRLRDAAFLLPPAGDAPQRLAFRHILGREAVYAGLLQENRSYLHARVLAVLETVDAQEPSVLAFHAKCCAHWMKAYGYAERAGRNSIDRAAPSAAIQFFMDALASLNQLSADAATRRAELDLRFLIRNTLFSLGRAREIGDHLLAAQRLAEALGDEAGEARAPLPQARITPGKWGAGGCDGGG